MSKVLTQGEVNVLHAQIEADAAQKLGVTIR